MSDVFWLEVDAFPDDTPHDALRHQLVTITEVEGPGFDGMLTFQVIGNYAEVTAAADVLDVDRSEIKCLK